MSFGSREHTPPPSSNAETPRGAGLSPVRARSGGLATGWAAALCVVLYIACKYPEKRELFEPTSNAEPSRPRPAAPGTGGEVTFDPSGATSSGAGNEAQGGRLPVVGQGGQANGMSDAFGGNAGLDQGPADAALSDAGTEDAAAPAIPCDDETLERCDGIDNDCDGAIDEQLACPVPCVGLAIDDHGYMLCTASVDRSAALAACAEQQMKLAWLETPSENAALLAIIDTFVVPGATDVSVQIGASDSAEEGVWRWLGAGSAADGFQFWAGARSSANSGPVGDAYVNWGDVEPNDFEEEDCALLTIRTSLTNGPGDWNDTGCEEPFPFICEQP